MRGLILLFLIMVFASVVHAETYQWTDSGGGVHFTDNLDNVPAKYRKKVRKVDVSPVIETTTEPQHRPSSPPAGQKEAAGLYGGHDEMWWRSSFSALRDEMKTIQDGLPAKKEKFAEAHRRHVIYSKPRDRIAQNEFDQQIKEDEARLAELRDQLGKLEDEATRAGVPMEWRH